MEASENAPVISVFDHPSSSPMGPMNTAKAYESTPYETVAVIPRTPIRAQP
jgi:hypothetical protein